MECTNWLYVKDGNNLDTSIIEHASQKIYKPINNFISFRYEYLIKIFYNWRGEE